MNLEHAQRHLCCICCLQKEDVLVLVLLAQTHTRLCSPGGYTPLSSLPCFIRRTLIFSLMSVSCRSGQKQSSAGAITTSKGITPPPPLLPTQTLLSNTRRCKIKMFRRLFLQGWNDPSPRKNIRTNRNVLPGRGDKRWSEMSTLLQ